MEKQLKDLKVIGINIKGRIKETHIFLDGDKNEIGQMAFKFWGTGATFKYGNKTLKLIKKGWLSKKYYLMEKDEILLRGKQKFLSRNASIYSSGNCNFKLKVTGYRRPYVLTDIDKNEDLFSISINRVAPPDIVIKMISERIKELTVSDYLIILSYFTWVCIKRARSFKF